MVTTSKATVSYAGTRPFRHYTVVGIILLVLLAVALMAAWMIVQNNAVQREETMLTSIGAAVLAFGLLYILFTLPRALQRIREEAMGQAASQPSLAPAAMSEPLPESRPVRVIEGIGSAYSERLEGIGVRTLRDLRSSDEDAIQQATGANAPTVAQWKAMAHLMALEAVDAQAAELLVRAGVETVERLAKADPATLHRRLWTFNRNGERRIVPDSIRLEKVRTWVASAKRGDFRPAARYGGAARATST